MTGWDEALKEFLGPFVARLGHKKRQQMCPLYVAGLIGPGERKSIQPMAERLAPARYDRFHHFISEGLWDEPPLEAELARTADRLVGGSDAVLVVDDTGLPKKGVHSVGVAPQYASMLGKRVNRRANGTPYRRANGTPWGGSEQAARDARPPKRRSERAACGQAGGGGQARFLKRQLSLPVSTMSQWWVRRSSSAVVILASPKTLGHSPNVRLVVTMTEVRS